MTLPDAPRLLPGKVVGSVVRADRPTPRTARLVVHLPGYAGTEPLVWTDEHVTLSDLSDDERTVVTRRCAVRRWDQDALVMTLEIHLHDGPGAELPRWARAYGVGSWVTVLGRHGELRPDPARNVLLLAGDEAGLPTILRTLEELPEGVSARVFVEVADAAERRAADLPAGAGLTWVLRGAAYGEALLAAVRAARLPDGAVQACQRGRPRSSGRCGGSPSTCTGSRPRTCRPCRCGGTARRPAAGGRPCASSGTRRSRPTTVLLAMVLLAMVLPTPTPTPVPRTTVLRGVARRGGCRPRARRGP